MKCPKCGGAPDNMVLTSNPVQYRCSKCDCIGTEVAWMTGLLRGDEGAKQAHAERLQAARDKAFKEKCRLQNLMNEYPQTLVRVVESIDRLIDAKLTLALLERG